MANIYLRLPVSRCLYFRHRDPDHPLASDEPLVFSRYSPEYFVLSNSLVCTDEVTARCFTQQQWKNMLRGRRADGGQTIMKRESKQYLSYNEILLLNGSGEREHSGNEDYLCMKLPNEVFLIDTVRAVTQTWRPGTAGIRQLVVMLNNDFIRSVVEWALATFDFCTSNGRVVCRMQTVMLERYLLRYGIEPTVTEKDNLRRIITRWLHSTHNNFSAYSCLDMKYEDSREKKVKIDDIIFS